MLQESIRSRFLTDELQLRQTVNEAVHAGQGAYFSLLLALLSPDVLDRVWTKPDAPPDNRKIDRRDWPVAPRIPLDLKEMSAVVAPDMLAVQLKDGGMASVRWCTSVAPEPLCRHQYMMHPLVWEDMSLLQQEKYRQEQTPQGMLPSDFAEDPELMVDTVAASRDWPDLRVQYYRPEYQATTRQGEYSV